MNERWSARHPNLAARFQALAAPGQVVIGEATQRLLGLGFELRDLGRQTLRGVAEPVAVPDASVTCRLRWALR